MHAHVCGCPSEKLEGKEENQLGGRSETTGASAFPAWKSETSCDSELLKVQLVEVQG